MTPPPGRTAGPATAGRPGGRGRPPSTSRGAIADAAMELFARQGFEQTTVDEIGAAVGINRRTLFRYFSSKNDIVWGDFSEHLERLRSSLRDGPADEPLVVAVRRAVLAFNDWGPDDGGLLRARMSLITTVPALQAHSALRYDEWCQVIAEFAAERLGVRPDDLGPETLAQAALGTAMAAYRLWVRDGGDLLALLDRGFGLLTTGFSDAALGAGGAI